MAMTRDSKKTFVERLRKDPAFARLLVEEVSTLFASGDSETARALLAGILTGTKNNLSSNLEAKQQKNTPNCGTCKHWDSDINALLKANGMEFRLCSNISIFSQSVYTKWSEDKGSYSTELKEEYKDKLAFAQDAASYVASLYTRAEFGCVQHEPVCDDKK